MKKLGINTLSNIFAKLWSTLSIYVFIPLYINILGEESYGLVSVFATLQSALNVLGMGLSNTLRREFASGDECETNTSRKYKLLRSVEMFYFAIGIVVVCLCSFCSDFIANDWLNIKNLEPTLVSKVISLMGISIALQLVANLYAGCLFGLERQVLANFLCIAWSLLKNVGSLLIIWLVQPNLIFFYGWHIIIDLLYMLVLRIRIVKLCRGQEKWRLFDLKIVHSIWRYTVGLFVISLISLVNRQLDKVIISKFLSLTDLGAYNVANTLGSLTAIFPSAVYMSIFPLFTNYATTSRNDELEKTFLGANRLVNLVLACMGGYIAIFAKELIYIWTHSQIYVDTLGVVASLVVLAVTILEFQQLPYALVLAHGNTRINIKVGLFFLPVVCALTFLAVSEYGLLGAGIVYALMMIGQTILFQFIVCKTYLPRKSFRVIVIDTIIPLFVSINSAIIVKKLIEIYTKVPIIKIVFGVVGGLTTLIILTKIYEKKDVFLFTSR